MSNASKIINILQKKYKADFGLERPYRVLISCILSHRTKDETSWPASDRLIKKADTAEKMVRLSVRQISKLIYPVGFYNQKAKRIKKVSKIILERYKGRVPRTREELMQLPGVGGKTADIVLLFAFGESIIPVDTHVAWVANQLGWTKSNNPERIREDLHRLIPKKLRPLVNSLLVEHGKQVCIRGRPKCGICIINKYCPSPFNI